MRSASTAGGGADPRRPPEAEAPTRRPLVYGSVCSGIEAASVAWAPLGWRPAWFAENARTPSAVLAHRWPGVPNYGDFTKIGGNVEAIDLLVGGTPCQSFSVAGLRGGMADARGNLALEYLRLARRLRPRWIVWENVPGCLSTNGGRDFASFLGGLAELGYGFAYRVLDAQFYGVAQRRRRVFVVGCLGDWRRAAAVLFERACLRGDPAPSRAPWENVAGSLRAGTEGGGWHVGGDEAAAGHLVVAGALTASQLARGRAGTEAACANHLVANPLTAASHRFDPSTDTLVVPIQSVNKVRTRRQNGIGIAEDGGAMYTLTGADQHAIAFHMIQDPISGPVSPALGAKTNGMGVMACGVPFIFDENQITHPENRATATPGHPAPTLNAHAHRLALAQAARVRRLTPRECERLQGLPDDYTLVPIGKSGRRSTADGARYRVIGNSMATPPVHWIGARIALVEAALAPTLPAPRPIELRAERVALGYTQPELAAALGVSQSLVARWEAGSRRIDPAVLDRLAAIPGRGRGKPLGPSILRGPYLAAQVPPPARAAGRVVAAAALAPGGGVVRARRRSLTPPPPGASAAAATSPQAKPPTVAAGRKRVTA